MKTHTMASDDARTQLNEALDIVAQGDVVIVELDGKLAAAIVPYEVYKKLNNYGVLRVQMPPLNVVP